MIFCESCVKLFMDMQMTVELTVRLFEELSRKREGELYSARRMLIPSLPSNSILGTETLAMVLSGTFLVQSEPEFRLRSAASLDATCEQRIIIR